VATTTPFRDYLLAQQGMAPGGGMPSPVPGARAPAAPPPAAPLGVGPTMSGAPVNPELLVTKPGLLFLRAIIDSLLERMGGAGDMGTTIPENVPPMGAQPTPMDMLGASGPPAGMEPEPMPSPMPPDLTPVAMPSGGPVARPMPPAGKPQPAPRRERFPKPPKTAGY
jgi:hypothetical protein